MIFLDAQERDFFLRLRLGPETRYESAKVDVRDRQSLVDIMRTHAVDVVVHTAGLIGKRVSEP